MMSERSKGAKINENKVELLMLFEGYERGGEGLITEFTYVL